MDALQPHGAPEANGMGLMFRFIKAGPFFRVYCPLVKNYKRKILGTNTRGNPLQFTPAEKQTITDGVKQLFIDLNQTP